MQCGLAQRLPRPLCFLLGKVPLKRYRLLKVKGLEISVSVVLFKPAKRLRGGITREGR